MLRQGTTVSRYMSPSVRAVYPTDSLELARKRFVEWKISALAVVEEVDDSIRLCGVITKSDLIRVGKYNGDSKSSDQLDLPDANVASTMSQNVVTVHESDLVVTAARHMVDNHIHRVFVEGDSGIAGVLSTRDVMRAIADHGIEDPISEYMTENVVAMHVATPVGDAIRALEEKGISAVVVLDKGWPCGIFTQEDALMAKKWRGEKLSDVMSPGILVLPETTGINRAASNAAAVDVRSVIVSRQNLMIGVLGGLDFCRAVI